MKNARTYEKKIRKLLGQLRRKRVAEAAPRQDPVRVMLEAVLTEDAPAKQAVQANARLDEEFVDINELRVAPVREIADCIGRDHPGARDKAGTLSTVLNTIFRSRNELSMGYMDEMAKRDLRRHLQELGLSQYAAAYLTLHAFGGHAVAVDRSLAECLAMDGYIAPDSDLADVRGFLERIIPARDALAAHELLRAYVASSADALAEKHRAEAEARAEAERQAAEEEARQAAAKRSRSARKSASARKRRRPGKAPAKAGASTRRRAGGKR